MKQHEQPHRPPMFCSSYEDYERVQAMLVKDKTKADRDLKMALAAVPVTALLGWWCGMQWYLVPWLLLAITHGFFLVKSSKDKATNLYDLNNMQAQYQNYAAIYESSQEHEKLTQLVGEIQIVGEIQRSQPQQVVVEETALPMARPARKKL